jgi:hypothetical protein
MKRAWLAASCVHRRQAPSDPFAALVAGCAQVWHMRLTRVQATACQTWILQGVLGKATRRAERYSMGYVNMLRLLTSCNFPFL